MPRFAPVALVAPVVLLAVLAIQLSVPVVRQSVTADEFAHVPAGLSYLLDGHFEIFSKNPPLVKVLAALPVWAADPAWRSRPVPAAQGNGWLPWVVGAEFHYLNAARYDALFQRARFVVVGLTVLLGAVLYGLCRRVFGGRSALVSLTLFAFCPTILAHGSVATVDLGAALLVFLAVVAARRFALAPRAGTAALAGVAVGLAVLAKFSALLLVPALAVVHASVRWREGSRRIVHELGLVGLGAALALLVVNLGYGFQDTLVPRGALPLVSRVGVALEPLVPAWVPVPLPRAFVTGLDQQTADVETGEFRGFLRRDWYRAGSWSYVLWVLLIKLPIPLLGLAALRALARPRLDREDAFLLVPAAAYLAAAILGHELQGALRYVLPAFPLVLASVGRVMESSLGRSRLGGALVMTLLAGHVLASMGTAPRYLSYFNELAGGPRNGYRHLLDSNLDWGQELFELRDYLAGRGNPRVKLAYFGHVDPALYGIRFEIPEGPDEPHGGLYAVSANYLMGHPYLVTRNGTLLPVPRDRFTWLQRHQPAARVGHSFFVYELP